jgi:hypothetical protein
MAQIQNCFINIEKNTHAAPCALEWFNLKMAQRFYQHIIEKHSRCALRLEVAQLQNGTKVETFCDAIERHSRCALRLEVA